MLLCCYIIGLAIMEWCYVFFRVSGLGLCYAVISFDIYCRNLGYLIFIFWCVGRGVLRFWIC